MKRDKSFAVVLSSVAPKEHDKCADIHRDPSESETAFLNALPGISEHTASI